VLIYVQMGCVDMGLLANRAPPNPPLPPEEYSKPYFDRLVNILNLFFQQINAVQPISIAQLNINVDTLPTDADYVNLRSGDVYRDVGAGNVLKVKV
jgi:hypothetical protein